jgi:hypothetical protein
VIPRRLFVHEVAEYPHDPQQSPAISIERKLLTIGHVHDAEDPHDALLLDQWAKHVFD